MTAALAAGWEEAPRARTYCGGALIVGEVEAYAGEVYVRPVNVYGTSWPTYVGRRVGTDRSLVVRYLGHLYREDGHYVHDFTSYVVRCSCGIEGAVATHRFSNPNYRGHWQVCCRMAARCRWCGTTDTARFANKRRACVACERAAQPSRAGVWPCGKPRLRMVMRRPIPAEHNCARCEPWRRGPGS